MDVVFTCAREKRVHIHSAAVVKSIRWSGRMAYPRAGDAFPVLPIWPSSPSHVCTFPHTHSGWFRPVRPRNAHGALKGAHDLPASRHPQKSTSPVSHKPQVSVQPFDAHGRAHFLTTTILCTSPSASPPEEPRTLQRVDSTLTTRGR